MKLKDSEIIRIINELWLWRAVEIEVKGSMRPAWKVFGKNEHRVRRSEENRQMVFSMQGVGETLDAIKATRTKIPIRDIPPPAREVAQNQIVRAVNEYLNNFTSAQKLFHDIQSAGLAALDLAAQIEKDRAQI